MTVTASEQWKRNNLRDDFCKNNLGIITQLYLHTNVNVDNGPDKYQRGKG